MMEKPNKKGLFQRSVGIVGTGSYVPKKIISNKELIENYNVNSTDEWIKEKIGIHHRRFVEEENQIDMGMKAIRIALDAANVDVNEIDLIICATTVGHYLSPGDAHFYQAGLNAKKAACIDINMACSNMGFALSVGSKYVADGTYNTVLVVCSIIAHNHLDFNDRLTAVFFGDGAGAVVLKEVLEDSGFLGFSLRSEGQGTEKLMIKGGGTGYPLRDHNIQENMQYIYMDGKAVWDYAINEFPAVVRAALNDANVTIEQVDFLISHQANINLIKKGMEVLGLPMSKTYTTLEQYGNTSGASAYITLDEAVRLGKIKKNDLVVVACFGVGFSSSSVVMRWCYDGT